MSVGAKQLSEKDMGGVSGKVPLGSTTSASGCFGEPAVDMCSTAAASAAGGDASGEARDPEEASRSLSTYTQEELLGPPEVAPTTLSMAACAACQLNVMRVYFNSARRLA